jgi:hypothetical protein
MSDNKALHGIGRAIVDADNINDLRAAALDALAEAHRITADCDAARQIRSEAGERHRAAGEALVLAVLNACGVRAADDARLFHGTAVEAVTTLRAERDKLATRVAELEAALAEKHSHASGQEWEIVLPMLGLTLRPRLDGVGVISATTTYTLNHPGGTPSPFERGVLLSGDSIGLGNDPVLSVCRILRSQT